MKKVQCLLLAVLIAFFQLSLVQAHADEAIDTWLISSACVVGISLCLDEPDEVLFLWCVSLVAECAFGLSEDDPAIRSESSSDILSSELLDAQGN